MGWLEAIVLGFFQGIAEFLPISSSGHLALLQQFFGITQGNLFYAEMLHFGTLLSILIVYFKDIKAIVLDFLKLIISIFKSKKIPTLNSNQKFAVLILIASIPTALIGLIFEDFIESMFSSVLPIGIAFIVTGFLLWFSEKKGNGNKSIENVTVKDSIFVGFMQGLAIFPGISRSGSTIVGALLRDFDRSLATEFSFILSIPAVLGSFLIGIKGAVENSSVTIELPIFIGVFISAITGIFAIKALIKMLENKKLHYFSFYLWIIGIIVIVSQFI
ncbi:MAG: undecaprenyl-diphosphate phosphatase [Tissierellales bacterium]|nr:undecaprenyl-diphosphate phosphatase [Tissierellales bacterium]